MYQYNLPVPPLKQKKKTKVSIRVALHVQCYLPVRMHLVTSTSTGVAHVNKPAYLIHNGFSVQTADVKT